VPEKTRKAREQERKLEALENILGYAFEDRDLLVQALCHKSYANEKGWSLDEANERLEFLGDSVVELSVTHLIFEDFPDAQEGDLTKLRASIVKGTALAKAAERIGLPEFILLGKGEEVTGGRKKRSILADTFEAVVGALYLDGGFDISRGFVLSVLEFVISDVVEKGIGDFKSELQELSAKKFGSIPRYRMTEEGPDHYKTFHATVVVGDKHFGPVPGTSKKEAEQGVARIALKKLGWKDADRIVR
jgi:ribonuclease-3